MTKYIEEKTFSQSETLAAMAVWEWEMEQFINPKKPFHKEIVAWREYKGANECRSAAAALGKWCEMVWECMGEAERDRAFDWEIVPAALARLDWSDCNGPNPPSAYDMAVRLTLFFGALDKACKIGETNSFTLDPVTIPGHDGLFVSLRVKAKHYDAANEDWLDICDAHPANLWSIEGETTDGLHLVLTDHGGDEGADDANQAALFLSALTGLPLKT